ncbi:MAG: AAC(3) family N-acetyltransferase [Pseudomonadota bacterium]
MTDATLPLRETLAADLRAMGLGAGDPVLVRCATRPIAPREKGVASALLDALLDVVGPEGTIVALTFTALQSAKLKKVEALFTDEARTTAGGFASAVLKHPGRKRSTHPANSIAAIGAQADFLVEGHDEHALPFSWMRRLIEIGGKQIVIGCVADSPGLSTAHFTQEELGLAGKSFLAGKEGCYVVGDGGARWVPRVDIPGCSGGFWKLYSPYVRAGILRTGLVGEAYSIMASAADSAAVELPILTADPNAALCDRPECLSCGSWSYSRRRLPRLGLAMLGLKAKAARKKLLGSPKSRTRA